jgi:site-specific DNA-methyltransferase (adenine-specific)
LPTLDKVDAVITDPPYGLNIAAQPFKHQRMNGAEKKDWDESAPTKSMLDEVLCKGKKSILWGGNYFPILWSNGCRGFVFWNKDVNFDSYSAGELAYTSFDKPAKYFYYAWNGLADGIRGRNKQQKTIHPTQKPVALYDWLLKNYAKEGDKILDTHVGSGSSRIAAHKGKFDFTGFEIDADYWNAQEKRYKDFASQLNLF